MTAGGVALSASGVGWMVLAVVWWLVVAGLSGDRMRRAPLSPLALGAAFLYALGTLPASAGIRAARQSGGWPATALSALVAAAVVAICFALLLVVVRRVRRRWAGASR